MNDEIRAPGQPVDKLRSGSLCTGIGGLDLAVEAHFGAELVWCAEWEDAPSTIIEREWPGVPNLRDLTAVDWRDVEPIDVLSAGYPCQPFSHAGKRKGQADERHLWPYIAEAVRVLRPRWVVLENVAGHLTLGFGDVLRDLAEAGFDAEWCVLRASDVGAPHRRSRLFIVARDANGPSEDALAQAGASRAAASERRGGAPAHADQTGPQGPQPAGRHLPAGSGRSAPTDTDRGRLQERLQRDGRQDEPRLEAPRRDDAHGRDEAPADADELGRMATRRDAGRVGGSQRSQEGRESTPRSPASDVADGRGKPGDGRRMMGNSTDGTTPHARSGEALRDVWGADDPQAVRSVTDARGHGQIPDSTELRTVMREPSVGGDEGSGTPPGAEAPAVEVRGVRDDRRSARPPQGQGSHEQRTEQPGDAVLVLPSEAALAGGPGQANGSDATPSTSAVRGLRTGLPPEACENAELFASVQGGAAQSADHRPLPGCGCWRWGQYAPAVHRWELVLCRPAPAPVDDGGRLSVRAVEWMMGYPEGWVDGLSRTQALKALGNAVVPQQGLAALRELACGQRAGVAA